MRDGRLAGALLATVLLAAATNASGQQTGTVSGRVRGPEGDPLPSARVTVLAQPGTAVTDRTGSFRITGVAAGRQTLVIAYVGFRTDTVAVDVTPGAARDLEVTMRISPVALPGIDVEGERGAQLRAINDQRLAQTILNVIPADEIGRLPDQNVAEAAQRVSAVSIQTSRGEGRFVSIRGTAPNLNNVTLNGQTLASTAESRATALDLLPASMVSAISITKAVTPDMDGNAVGGTVDIQTLSAFDRDRPFLFGAIKGVRHQQQVPNYGDDKLPYEAELTGGTRFGAARNIGIVFAGALSRRDFTASVLDPDGWQEESGSIIPEELELQVEDNERQRFGLTTNFDWRPSPNTNLFLRALYTRTREVTANSEYEFGFEGDLTMQNTTVGRYTAGSAELDLSEDEETESLYATTLGLAHRLSDNLLWDFSGTFTRGIADRVGPDVTFETSGDDEGRLSSTFDVGPYFFKIDPDEPGFIANPANYPLRSANWQIESNTENTWTAVSNLRLDSRLGDLPVMFELGGKFQVRDKVIDDQTFAYVPHGITLAPYALPATGTVQGGYDAFVHGDVGRFSGFFSQNRGNSSLFELNAAATAINEVESDSDNMERILAGFVMGTTEIGRVSLLAGVRVEHTRTESRRFELSENEDTEDVDVTDRTFENSYTNMLPAIVLKADAARNLVLRAAWTNTIGRADYEELAGFRALTYEPTSTPNVFEGSLSEGNPGLKPYKASNLDISAEYYFPFGGLVSAGGFHKTIDDPIYEFNVNERDFTFEGLFFAELERSQDRNAEAGTLRGVEFSYSQPLFFLPKPFDGLGITANAAFIDSEVEVPGREGEKLPFFGQSDRVFNVIPYFRRGPLELRLAWTYRGEYLSEIGDEPFEDRYGDVRETIDLTARYTFLAERLQLFAQLRNMTNEPEVGFQGIRSRYDVHTLTGRTFSIGLSANY